MTNNLDNNTSGFHPDSWDGDPEELTAVQEDLVLDEDLCEQTFMSKQEAFSAGLYLGSKYTPGQCA